MMNNYEKYYNDKEIINEPKPLREVHAIRLMIYDETKDMTLEERAKYYNDTGKHLADKYGFKRVARVN